MEKNSKKVLKYNKIILSAYGKEGMIYALNKKKFPIIEDGEPVDCLEDIILELRDGTYCDYMFCVSGGKLVSNAMKELLCKYVDDDSDIEFIPVTIHSKEYGNREYFLMHFKTVVDRIDYENSTMNPVTNTVIKEAADFYKIQGSQIYVSSLSTHNLIVTNKVMREIKKNKMHKGISFTPVYCYNKPSFEK